MDGLALDGAAARRRQVGWWSSRTGGAPRMRAAAVWDALGGRDADKYYSRAVVLSWCVFWLFVACARASACVCLVCVCVAACGSALPPGLRDSH